MVCVHGSTLRNIKGIWGAVTRYACTYWDNTASLWKLDGINNDETTESQNYIGCYTKHLTDFAVVYRNKTNFFALEFVEVT